MTCTTVFYKKKKKLSLKRFSVGSSNIFFFYASASQTFKMSGNLRLNRLRKLFKMAF